jgi:D-arabinose 1-dehydrogenase-like Zn-dependent alcohol dehydrogenase
MAVTPVLVVGGGGVGLEVTKTLAKAGSWVTAFQRSDKFRKNIEELGAMLSIGDVMELPTIEKALRSNTFDAVVCTVGESFISERIFLVFPAKQNLKRENFIKLGF